MLRSIEAVVELLALRKGWNSYSANPIQPRNVIEAIRIIVQYLKPEVPVPAVVPTVKGGIQLEWHTNGVDLEIYIETPGSITLFAEKFESADCLSDVPLKGNEGKLKTWLQAIAEK